MPIQITVYALCGIASLTCTILLARGYLASRMRLLFWGALCFGFLTATNVLLFVDLVIFREAVSLLPWRNLLTLLGLLLFLYGMIFDSEKRDGKP